MLVFSVVPTVRHSEKAVSTETQKSEVAWGCGRWKNGQIEPKGCLGKEAVCVVLKLTTCSQAWFIPLGCTPSGLQGDCGR